MSRVVGMRAGALTASRAALLAGPTAIAFFSGGYFDEARAWAGLGAWLLVVLAALLNPQAIPCTRSSWLAIGGLGMFAAWTLLSIVWAPVAGNAYHAGQIVVLYVGALLASVLLLSGRSSQRLVEPALAAGAVIVIGYGISARLLPGLLHFSRSLSAQGRLEQPLTYWNAMGELAAIGLVLAVRVAGDTTRAGWMRMSAAAATAPLGMGLYLSFSRGALFACAAGLVTLVVVVRRREQLTALLVSLAASVLASVAAAPFRGVTSLSGGIATRERQGAITLALLVAITIGAAVVQGMLVRRERPGELRLPRRASAIALALICAGLAIAIVVGAKEKSRLGLTSGAGRLTTLESNRYNYWRVAFRAFKAEPIRGVGAGGWSIWWLRYRPNTEFAQDAHSLPLQTLAELGIVGLALLAVFLAGIWGVARRAYRAAPRLAAGPIAGFVVYIVHSPLDWDWQMPAVTLVAIGLAGSLIALAERANPDEDEASTIARPSRPAVAVRA